MANHDFGVPVAGATAERTAYHLSETIGLEFGMGCFIELSTHWSAVLSVSAEQLDREVTRSPIVGEDYLLKGFAAVSTLL